MDLNKINILSYLKDKNFYNEYTFKEYDFLFNIFLENKNFSNHGNHYKWIKILKSLPNISTSYLNYSNSSIIIGKKNEINDCLFVTGGRIYNEPDLPYRKSGCAALDMAYVASGRYDGYFQQNLNLWDIAAGIILVKEAGGVLNEVDLSIHKNIKIIASSTNISSKLLEKLKNF